MSLIDIHTHLTHEKFQNDLDAIIKKAESLGFTDIVTNGLDLKSNREVLHLAEKYKIIKPALGIYPIDTHLFNADEEIFH